MNYIKELNAFYDWLELNELSPSAINLWYALMHINNKAGWIETFTVAESVLCVKTGLTDRTLRKVRNELKQKNRIDFVSRKGGKAPIYKLVSFFSTENISAPIRTTEINSVVSVTDSVIDDVTGSSTLNKLNKTKLNKTNISTATRVNYFDEYMLCFSGQPNPIQIQEINSFIDQDGLNEEVICASFKKAAEAGAKYPYARSILNSWAKKGIKTIQDVENEQNIHEQRKKQQRQKTRRGAVPLRTEKLPSWFDENQQNTDKPKQQPSDDIRQKRAELQETLKRMKAGG
ncbi:DnaD domain-containing protein [Cytobacillus massiliigabonensis]|uniref:DnaD domain-containing protein n=1 Tax=Cytobacillus massiliigabonensis TaxID=1871011 RepID=UPI000C84DA93|nr:DnaD domain protein [Cytobacillus massiliigabonensis]